MSGPLKGIRVVEFTEIIAVPLAGMQLSDLGADVIKIEPPWGDPWRHLASDVAGEARLFIAFNRGKWSVTLDLTADAAGERSCSAWLPVQTW